jgi:hypothetical protein
MVFSEIGPNGTGTIGKAQYVKAGGKTMRWECCWTDTCSAPVTHDEEEKAMEQYVAHRCSEFSSKTPKKQPAHFLRTIGLAERLKAGTGTGLSLDFSDEC